MMCFKVPATSHAKSSEAICLITLPWIYTDWCHMPQDWDSNSPHPHLLKIWTAFVNCSLLEPSCFLQFLWDCWPWLCDPIRLFLQCPRIRCAEQETSAHSLRPFPLSVLIQFGNKSLPLICSLCVAFWLEKVIHVVDYEISEKKSLLVSIPHDDWF